MKYIINLIVLIKMKLKKKKKNWKKIPAISSIKILKTIEY